MLTRKVVLLHVVCKKTEKDSEKMKIAKNLTELIGHTPLVELTAYGQKHDSFNSFASFYLRL